MLLYIVWSTGFIVGNSGAEADQSKVVGLLGQSNSLAAFAPKKKKKLNL